MLSLVLSFVVLAGFVNPLFAQQQNQTNMTTSTQQNQTGVEGGAGQQQQNQTGIGSASELENLTADNTGLLQNASDIGSQNTSTTGGMQQEQTTTDPNMTNQTGAMTNATNQTGGGGAGQQQQQGNQTEKGPLEQLGEAIGGVFGGGNQSK